MPFAAERRCNAPAYMPTGRSAANPPAAVAAIDRWQRKTDGQTDGRTPDRYIDPAPHRMRAALISCHLYFSAHTEFIERAYGQTDPVVELFA